MATIGTKLHTFFHGQRVGRDEFGNVYYQAKKAPKTGRRKRWVVYKGLAEPSKVPAHWHGWLHYSTDEVPVSGQAVRLYPWQKEHLPNLTGTALKYVPPGHLLRGAQRDAASADYTPWKPE